MSLPARQQRVINQMEGTLGASEPDLAAMFAIFARLNEGQPIGVESLESTRLGRTRRLWLAPGDAMYAILLVPVMFIAVIVGVVLGGARNTGTCEVGYSAGGGAQALSRSTCATTGETTVIPTTSRIRSAPCATPPPTGSPGPAA